MKRSAKKLVHIYIDDEYSEMPESHKAALVVGSLWMLLDDVYIEPDNANEALHEHKYLHRGNYNYGGGVLRRGTPAVYVGTKRVEEERKGCIGTFVKHAFLVCGVVYFAGRMSTFVPVS